MTVSRRQVLAGASATVALAACGRPPSRSSTGSMAISAIPDQDPELLNRLYPRVADRLAGATGVRVTYRPVTDYTAVVRGFELGDLDLAWMGGLTGVQARSLVPGATAVAQRDIDANFHSVFIAHADSGLAKFDDDADLQRLAGHSFAFGSETSTSGRLMPEYFMQEAGFDVADFKGKPGFSGSHDATLELVANGSFEAGVLNEQVWQAAKDAGEVDLSKVVLLWRTPGYPDYHWLARPDIDKKYGAGTLAKIKKCLFALDKAKSKDSQILDLFGAESFVPTKNSNYDRIETVARELDLLT